MIKILAIDPEVEKPAYSIFVGGSLSKFGFIDRKKPKGEVDYIEYQNALLRLMNECDEVFVEGQFSGINKATFEKLVSVRQEIFYQAKVLGKHCEVVPPVTWQSKILRCRPSDKREVRKQLSQTIATALSKRKINNHNLADAINIGCYGYGKYKQRMIVKQLKINNLNIDKP